MAVHLVGSKSPPATVRLSGTIQFRGLRRVPGRVAGDITDEDEFAGATVECQRGAPPKSGDTCLACPRLLTYERGAEAGQLIVTCAFSDTDPVGSRMTCAPGLVTAAPGEPCAEVAARAHGAGVRHVVVVREGALVGVASRHDLAQGASEQARVEKVMARDVFAITLSASLGEAAAAMSALDIGCLPVVRDQFLVGILTWGDLRRAGMK